MEWSCFPSIRPRRRADIYWDGTAAGWNSTSATTAVPGSGHTAIFNITTVNAAETISLNANQAANGLIFNNTSSTSLQGDGERRRRQQPMRVVVQRVSRASVTIGGQVVGKIGSGLLLLVGFKSDDTEDALVWMADKVIGLRIFGDEEGKMNRALADAGGGLLVVSQFTLYGDASKGRRPSFLDAAPPPIAIPLYERFVELLRSRSAGPVETGEFGAMMAVALVNDGPVTLLLER